MLRRPSGARPSSPPGTASSGRGPGRRSSPAPSRAREQVNAGLAAIYGRRVPSIEEAAVAGTVSECVAAAQAVADAGAELILFTPLYDVPGHMEQIAAEIIPRLDA